MIGVLVHTRIMPINFHEARVRSADRKPTARPWRTTLVDVFGLTLAGGLLVVMAVLGILGLMTFAAYISVMALVEVVGEAVDRFRQRR